MSMRQLDRIYRLYQVIRARRRPVPMAVLIERMECSRSTVKRAIRDLRSFAAPLEYDRDRRGYYFDDADGERYELPGLWFNQDEIYALLVTHEVLRGLRSDLLDGHIAPLRARIESLLERGGVGRGRVRMPGIGARHIDPDAFRKVSSALAGRRRVRTTYRARGTGESLTRTLSPQRLVYYRNNWYLDAWCHLRRGLRTFSVDRMGAVRILAEAAREMDPFKLDAHVGGSYGIFAGKPKHFARIRFSATVSPWVVDVKWHGAQRERRLADGGIELEIPFNNPTELLMDILRYGADAEVIAPRELRAQVGARLGAACALYAK